jgi:hypothetical protein
MSGQTDDLREGAESEEGPFLFGRSSTLTSSDLVGSWCWAYVCLGYALQVFACQVCVLCCFW